MGRRESMIATFSSRDVPEIPLDVATALYRITQEALRNISKHAGQTHARVSLRGTPDGVQLQVADFGAGLRHGVPPVRSGFVEYGGACAPDRSTLRVQSLLGDGTRITVDVPLAGCAGRRVTASMAVKRDLIVLGASAGGVEALRRYAGGFRRISPRQFSSCCTCLHARPACSRSILSRAGRLRAAHATDGEPIEQGRIYIAPPDHHMAIERDHVHLTWGPKEQHHRPCINVTFRSAAAAYRDRVAGVVLSGEARRRHRRPLGNRSQGRCDGCAAPRGGGVPVDAASQRVARVGSGLHGSAG